MSGIQCCAVTHNVLLYNVMHTGGYVLRCLVWVVHIPDNLGYNINLQ